MGYKSKDSQKVKEFNINCYTKGFTSDFTLKDENNNDILTYEYFQFKEIYQLIHYPNVGVEVLNFNGERRVFYNDIAGQSQLIFDLINNAIISWMNSNLN